MLLTIGGTTREKWRPNFDTPAPIHTATISSFKAMIKSTGPRTAKKISAGTYCSLRAARNTTLSRRPITMSRPISVSSSTGLTKLTPVLVTVGATSAVIDVAMIAT